MRAHKLHGAFKHYAAGTGVDYRHEVDSVAAVVSGRVRLQLEGEPEAMLLRASDAATIPAGVSYHMEFAEPSTVYHYTESRDDLWGV
jgi:mannose-6-phosphate isomerase-like protein (cupin superfamily)